MRLADTAAHVSAVNVLSCLSGPTEWPFLVGCMGVRTSMTTTPSWPRWQPANACGWALLALQHAVSATCVGAWLWLVGAFGVVDYRRRLWAWPRYYPLITKWMMLVWRGDWPGAIASFVMLALLALTCLGSWCRTLPLALFGAIAVSLAANSYSPAFALCRGGP